MKHYVIYHSVNKRGDIIPPSEGQIFAILTGRPVAAAIGARIWLISGEGSPTSYHLHFAFTAEGTESGEDEGFRHRVYGSEGLRFTPPVCLDSEPWFPAFLKGQGNFAFGLSEIKQQQAVAGLSGIASAAPSMAAEVNELQAWPLSDPIFPDEVGASESYLEGAVLQVRVNAYERDRAARAACISHFGCQCIVCGFDFAEYYGALGAGFIHVHHLTPIFEVGGEYQVDPIRDLVPVCPNCHAMLHAGGSPPTLEELREIYDNNVKGS